MRSCPTGIRGSSSARSWSCWTRPRPSRPPTTHRGDPDMKTVNRARSLASLAWRWSSLVVPLALAACAGNAGEASEEALSEATMPDGMVVLDSAAAESVGLTVVEVAPVGEATLSATGMVLYDQNRVSRVGPRVEGRVVRIARDLGDLVAAGAPLAVLESAELGEVEAEH
ncbi:MAG: hypothetical protein FIA95_16485, partial [Gemmatimonadetes bacterium]|nr:hypothetical protein [Gemmatimonadota bacterium]